MATNGITSSRAPRRRTRSTRLVGAGNPSFIGDPILERDAGERGRLAGVKAQTMSGLHAEARIELLREAGINVRGNL